MKSRFYGTLLLLSVLNIIQLHAQQLTTGDEFSYTDSEGVTRTFVITGENIISNPSFDDGVAGWTGGNGGTMQNAIVHPTGGVDNGAYIVPTTNASMFDDHSLVTYWEIQKGKNYVFSFFEKGMSDNSIAIEKEGYIEAVQTNVKHDSQKIFNILHAHVDANGVWTQNIVVTEAQYQYLGIVARWLDSNRGFDAFILAEVEETLPSAKHRLSLLIEKCEDKIEECESSIEEHETPIRLGIFIEIIEECRNIIALEDVVTSQVLELITKLEYALLDFSMANFIEGEAIDVTRYYVKNPKFDHMFTNWELDNPMYDEGGVSKGSNMRFLKHFGEESREAEIFVDPTKDTHISQIITNIPNGYYNFTLDCVMTHNAHNSGEKSGVAIYCNNGEADVKTQKDTEASADSSNSYPERFSVQGIVAENSLTIGMVGYAASNFSYTAFDNIKLEYVGKLTSFAELTYLINKAKDTLESYANPIGYDEFKTTIHSIENNSDNNKSDEEIVSMINRLKKAIEQFIHLNTTETPDSTWVYYITTSVADSLVGEIRAASTCKHGDSLVIDILPNENYELDTLLINGVNVAKLVENDKFIIESVTNDIVIYAVFSPVCYLTLQHADNGCIKQRIIKGNQYSFILMPKDGWDIHSVIFNGEDVTSQIGDGDTFVTPTIYGDGVLNVAFEQNGNTVRNAHENAVKVYGYNGIIKIYGVECGNEIAVYTSDGALVNSQVANAANVSIVADTDKVYVVKVADKVVKVRM